MIFIKAEKYFFRLIFFFRGPLFSIQTGIRRQLNGERVEREERGNELSFVVEKITNVKQVLRPCITRLFFQPYP